MKIKFLSLLLIFAGIILISGCVDREAQLPDYKASGDPYMHNLERIIFYPYSGLLNCEGPELPDHPHDLLQGGPDQDPEGTQNLIAAKSLLDRNIDKAENISTRLEEGIHNLKAEGEDVSRLEALFGEYELHIDEAKKYRALADTAAEEKNNSSVADSEYTLCENSEREYLIESQKNMIQADHVLKKIFYEFQSTMSGSEELNDTSRLNASGEGRALLTGEFALNIHLENGVIIIPEISPDSEIDIKGDYTFKEEKTEMQDEVFVYNIESADVKISGSHKTVMIGGTNISVTADGAGYLNFIGNGTYSIEDAGKIIKEGNKWGISLFEEKGPEKHGIDGKDRETETGHKTGINIAEEDRVGPDPRDKRSFI